MVQGREKSASSGHTANPRSYISCMVEQEKKFKFLWGYPNPEVERGNESPINNFTPRGAAKEAGRKEEAARTHLSQDWGSFHCWRGSNSLVLGGLLLA